MSPTTATAVFDVMGFSTLVGRPLIGLLLDRVFAPYVAVAFFLAPLIGLSLAGGGRGAVAGNWRGAAWARARRGDRPDRVPNDALSRSRAFGEIYGYLFKAFVMGSSLGPFPSESDLTDWAPICRR